MRCDSSHAFRPNKLAPTVAKRAEPRPDGIGGVLVGGGRTVRAELLQGLLMLVFKCVLLGGVGARGGARVV